MSYYFILRESDFFHASYEKFSDNLTLEVQSYPWKCQRFNAIDESIKMLKKVKFQKMSVKMKSFTRSKQRAALRKLFSLSQATFFCFNYYVFDDIHWNVWTNMKMLYGRNNILKKQFQIWDFESFIFWSKFCFWGLL